MQEEMEDAVRRNNLKNAARGSFLPQIRKGRNEALVTLRTERDILNKSEITPKH